VLKRNSADIEVLQQRVDAEAGLLRGLAQQLEPPVVPGSDTISLLGDGSPLSGQGQGCGVAEGEGAAEAPGRGVDEEDEDVLEGLRALSELGVGDRHLEDPTLEEVRDKGHMLWMHSPGRRCCRVVTRG
jgi:hypothetical protein